jgi:hypothetical protein
MRILLPAIGVLCLVTSPSLAEPLDARALVEKWLAVQNGGDFEGYQALYATHFVGIRRSGPRTTRFNRAGWMKDRARMFRQPMVVAVDNIKVIPAGEQTSMVTFQQIWKSGHYEDVGRKRLVLTTEAGMPRIAREEMLTSAQLESGPRRPLERYAQIYDGEVLLDTRPPEDLSVGPISPHPHAGSVRKVRLDRLSSELRAWIGRKVKVYGGPSTCEATVGEIHLIGDAIPSIGTQDEWRENHTSERGKAEAIWGMAADGGRFLTATLVGGCKGTFVRAAELPAPAFVPAVPADAAWRSLAVRALKRLLGGTPWTEAPTVSVMRGSAHGLPLTLVQVMAHGEEQGCGSYDGEWSMVFELTEGAQPKLTLRGKPNDVLPPVKAMLDIDEDGEPELLLGTGFLRKKGTSYDAEEQIDVPWFGCTC